MKRIFPQPFHDPRRTFCAIPTCHEKVSPRYNVPICHEHMLFCWWIVDQDRQQAEQSAQDFAASLDDPFRETDRRYRETFSPPPKKRPKAVGERGFIYYLQVGDYLKIGFTSDLEGRMRSYPPNAEILAITGGSRDDEKRIHDKFSAFCDSGREWYRDVPEIRRHINRVKKRPDAVDRSQFPQSRRGNTKKPTPIRPRGGTWGRAI